jgi:hypothetical protein
MDDAPVDATKRSNSRQTLRNAEEGLRKEINHGYQTQWLTTIQQRTRRLVHRRGPYGTTFHGP